MVLLPSFLSPVPIAWDLAGFGGFVRSILAVSSLGLEGTGRSSLPKGGKGSGFWTNNEFMSIRDRKVVKLRLRLHTDQWSLHQTRQWAFLSPPTDKFQHFVCTGLWKKVIWGSMTFKIRIIAFLRLRCSVAGYKKRKHNGGRFRRAIKGPPKGWSWNANSSCKRLGFLIVDLIFCHL